MLTISRDVIIADFTIAWFSMKFLSSTIMNIRNGSTLKLSDKTDPYK